MRVLFLDFDGVLNSRKFFSDRKNHPQKYSLFDDRAYFDPEAIRLLNSLLEEHPDLKIVVSSAWRIGRTATQLSEMLEEVGLLPGRLIDRTGDISESGSERGWEIQDWLNAHPEVTSMVILDDDSDMVHLKDHHVKTSFSMGLTKELVVQAGLILRKVYENK